MCRGSHGAVICGGRDASSQGCSGKGFRTSMKREVAGVGRVGTWHVVRSYGCHPGRFGLLLMFRGAKCEWNFYNDNRNNALRTALSGGGKFEGEGRFSYSSCVVVVHTR
jgi:hypothetical protein